MDEKQDHRIYRQATDEERSRHELAREQIAAELPEIKERARAALGALGEERHSHSPRHCSLAGGTRTARTESGRLERANRD